MAETWTLDGLAINDNTSFRIAGEVDMTPPRQRQEWIGAADSEWQALARDPDYENREIVIPLEVIPTATKDQAHDKVGQIVDKLRLASRTPTGIALTWAPHNSSRTVTFDVLAGEITGLPLDFLFVDANMPRPTLRLVCKPEWRGSEVTTSTASSSTPFVTLEIANVPGDRPALGRLIVTDTATQSRRHVEWGLEGQYYNASTSLLVASDDMVTSGFGGSQTTTTGAYDPNASGNNSITCGLTTTATAVAGTGNLSHVGTFRVKGRVQATTTSVQVRLVWQAADGPWNENDWVTLMLGASSWEEHDLGTITVPPVLVGTQRWQARIEARTTTGTDTLKLNYLELVPTLDGYGKARAVAATTSGILTGYDQFTSTTAGNNLNARVAPAGGTWATSGDATDLQFSDDAAVGSETVKRSTTGDTNGRYAILGSATPTDVEVESAVWRDLNPSVNGTEIRHGVIARWTDSSNYVRGSFIVARASGVSVRTLEIRQFVAGVDTAVASLALSSTTAGTAAWWVVQLVVYASGRTILRLLDSTKASTIAEVEGQSSALATGGTLASGMSGIYDRSNATGPSRYYDNVGVSTPAAEPIVLYSGRNMQFRHDDTIRQDSSGTYTGSPPSYRGSRFLVPVGTSRVMVKARRNDVEVAADGNVTDALQIQVGYTSRGLVVPR